MKALKRLGSFLLALIMVLSMIPATHTHAAEVTSGYCGDPDVNDGKDVTWTLADGVLTISGTGKTKSYSSVAEMYGAPISCSKLSTPWNENEVTSLVVEEGVTHILGLMCWGVYGLTEVSLPDSLKVIGYCSFEDCDSLTSITIPKNVTGIWNHAFFACENLTSITFTGDAPNIDDHAFSAVVTATCYYPASANWPADKLKNYGGNLTWVAYDACADGHSFGTDDVCTGCGILGGSCGSDLIWTLDDAGNLTITGTGSMEDYNFGSSPFYKYADKITSVSLPEGLTSIGERAFDAAFPNLDHIEIPTSVTHIQDCAFGATYNKVKLKYPGTMAQWDSIYIDAISSYGLQYGAECSDGTIVYMGPCGGSNGLYDSVKYMLLGDGTLKITGSGAMTFYRYLNYESCFSSDAKIKKVEISEGVTNIAGYAFKNCTNLTEVHIPASVTSISYNVFQGCTALTDVYYGSNEKNWNKMSISSDSNEPLAAATIHYTDLCAGGHSWVDATCTAPKTCPVCDATEGEALGHSWVDATCTAPKTCSVCGETEGEAIPTAHTWVEANCTYAKTCSTCNITEGDAILDAHVFEGGVCQYCGLQGGTCGENAWWKLIDGVLTIYGSGEMTSAPWPKASITTVIMEEGITSICESAFEDCEKLTAVTIPDTVTKLGSSCFYGCEILASVKLPEGITAIPSSAFAYCWALTGIEIPESVTSIGYKAFAYCREMVGMQIPEKVTSISGDAFTGCSKLKFVRFNGNAPTLGSYAFRSLTLTAFYPGYDTTWTADVRKSYGGSVTWVAYDQNHLEHSFDSNGVCSCGCIGGTCGQNAQWALDPATGTLYISGTGKMEDFYSSSQTPWANYKNAVRKVVVEEGITHVGGCAFKEFSNLETVSLPDSLTSIGSEAIMLCPKLKEIEIPENVTQIGVYAFEQCYGLESVVLPEGLSTISDGLFNTCTSLKSVTIPASVTTIARSAFNGCNSLADVYYGSNEKAWNQISIGSYNNPLLSATIHYTDPCLQGHTWKNADCVAPKTCTVCGETEGEALGHAYERGICSRCDAVHPNLAGYSGKTISILGDSISTFTGVSNDPNASTAIQNNATFYNGSVLGVGLADTWWQQIVDALDLELLVNNSWSGSCIYTTRAGTPGAYVARCEQLHNNAGTVPDVIAIYLGTNDYYNFKSTLGSAGAIDYAQLIRETADGYTYAEPTTAMEAYAIMLHKMTKRYPMAEIYCFTLLPMRNLSAADQLLLEQFNDGIKELADRFDVNVVDLYTDSGIKTDDHFQDYIADNSVHPGPLGMDAITDVFVDELLEQGAPASHTHSYEGVVTPPTCTEQGYTTYICTACGGSYVADRVPAKNHDWQDADCVNPKTCKVCGETEGEALGHDWVDADCETAKTCKVCGETEGAPLDHNWTPADCENPKTCTRCGETEGAPLNHNWLDATCVAPKTCDRCGATEGEAIPGAHNFVNGACEHCKMYGGYCGDPNVNDGKDVMWILDFTGKLTISGTGAMANFNVDAPWCDHRNSIKEVIIESGVTTVGNHAFRDCTVMTDITIDQGVTSIGNGAFVNCFVLSDITIPNSVTTIGDSAFAYCTGLTSVTIPDSVTSLGECAFFNCNNVEELVLSNKLVAIEERTFSWCERLLRVEIPESVECIGYAAFEGCSLLNQVVIGDLVGTVEESAFSSCPSLNKVIYCGTESQWNEINVETGNDALKNAARQYHDYPEADCMELRTCNICGETEIVDHTWADADCVTPKTCSVCGETEGEALGHNWVDADCETAKTCTVCGATEGTATGHAWIEATCYSLKTCNNCGITEGELLPHDWAPADCDHPKHCKNCSATEGNALDHDWTPADCQNPKTCDRCGKTEGVVTGHSWVGPTCYAPKTCSVCGAIDSVAWGHNWLLADCDTPETCSICGETRGEALGHDWVDANCTAPKTCTVCGETEGEALGHNWLAATCIAPETCTGCGITRGEKFPHTPVVDAAVEATCTATGLTEGQHCSACGEVLVAQQTVPTKNHTWKSATCTTPKTCTVCGETEGEALGHNWVAADCDTAKACSVCGATEGNPLGHTVVTDKAVEATCTATGLTEGKHCSVCGEVLVAQQTVPTKNHTWKSATCTAPKTCTVCGQTNGNAKGHDWKAATCTEDSVCNQCGEVAYGTKLPHAEAVVSAVAATCTSVGKTEGKYCTVCDTVTKAQQTIPALGHTEVIDPAVEATCTTIGKTEGSHCKVCGTVIAAQQTIHAKGHAAVPDAAVAATCTTSGKTSGSHCKICGEVIMAQVIIPAAGHSWQDGNCYAPKTCKVCGVKEGGVVHAYEHRYDYKCDLCGVERIVDMTRSMVDMFRMYDPNSGEHFYTGSTVERDNLVAVGWQYEGVGFTFPLTTGDPVHRLYDPVYGEHLYTMDVEEMNELLAAGWNYEGIAFNSGFENEVPQYRLHNPNETRGAYHFTASIEERDHLISLGWEYQGIGWYSLGT